MTVVATVFCGKLRNLSSAPQSQPIIPCLTQAVARCLVFLVEFVALYYLRENSSCRKIIRVDDRIRRANSSGMMGIAGGGHRQTADLRVFESVSVVTTQCGCGIENFDRIDGKRLESGQADSGAKQIVGMGRNSETPTLVNDFADFACGFSFQIGQLGADTKQ